MKRMIKCSKYNEVYLPSVADLINKQWQIIQPKERNGALVGTLKLEDGNNVHLYADDSIMINNVIFPIAAADESYFDCELEINLV